MINLNFIFIYHGNITLMFTLCRKKSRATNYDPMESNYVIVDLAKLNELFSSFKCALCDTLCTYEEISGIFTGGTFYSVKLVSILHGFSDIL